MASSLSAVLIVVRIFFPSGFFAESACESVSSLFVFLSRSALAFMAFGVICQKMFSPVSVFALKSFIYVPAGTFSSIAFICEAVILGFLSFFCPKDTVSCSRFLLYFSGGSIGWDVCSCLAAGVAGRLKVIFIFVPLFMFFCIKTGHENFLTLKSGIYVENSSDTIKSPSF